MGLTSVFADVFGQVQAAREIAIAGLLILVIDLALFVFFASRAAMLQARYGNFTRTLLDASYLKWERAVLGRLYAEDVFTLCGNRYVAIRRVAPRDLRTPRIGNDALKFCDLVVLKGAKIAERESEYSAEGRAYLQYAKQRRIVRDPERLGFEPLHWNLHSDGPLVELGVSRFRDTVATEAALRWEMYEQYAHGANATEVVLPLRVKLNLIGSAIPYSRPGFRPMLSVKALSVLVQDGIPKLVVMKRSDEVASYQGFWQFPPAGSMEVFGIVEEDDPDELRNHSDPGASLRREFIEELFGVDEWQAAKDETFTSLETSPKGERLRQAFEGGSASVTFMGIVADTVTLRGELSFLILVHNAKWELRRGVEARSELQVKTFAEVASLLSRDGLHLDPASAALLRLAIDSGALEEAGILTRAETVQLFDGEEYSEPK